MAQPNAAAANAAKNTAFKQFMAGYVYAKLGKNLPQSELDFVYRYGPPCENPDCAPAENKHSAACEQRLRMDLVALRLTNAICNHCHRKPPAPVQLRVCGQCQLVWYCGEPCRVADAARHGAWCCTPGAARQEDDPNTPVFIMLPERVEPNTAAIKVTEAQAAESRQRWLEMTTREAADAAKAAAPAAAKATAPAEKRL
jgi:hypothetical protein